MQKAGSLCLALLFAAVFPVAAHADANADALKAISDASDGICGMIATTGWVKSEKFGGDIKGELGGLAKRLAELGLSGSGSIETSNYSGVLQNDLSTSLSSQRECKLKVFASLVDKLITPVDAKPKDDATDARRELGRLGIAWKVGEFTEAAHEGNEDVIQLFIKGGMKYPSEDLQWHVFRPDSGQFPYRSYILIKEKGAFDQPESICANPETLASEDTNQFLDPVSLLARDAQRREIARWLCSISKSHSALVVAIQNERTRIATASARNAAIQERRESCVKQLRHQLSFNQILGAASQYNIFDHATIGSVRERAIANMAADLGAGKVTDDPKGSYEGALKAGCATETPEGTGMHKLEELERVDKILF